MYFANIYFQGCNNLIQRVFCTFYILDIIVHSLFCEIYILSILKKLSQNLHVNV